jgi:hypothetical protein
MGVCAPAASEIEATAELFVPDGIRGNGRILIQESVRSPQLQALGAEYFFCQFVDRTKNRAKRIRLDERIGSSASQGADLPSCSVQPQAGRIEATAKASNSSQLGLR